MKFNGDFYFKDFIRKWIHAFTVNDCIYRLLIGNLNCYNIDIVVKERDKSFILNSDDTFKKSEEAYNTIQKFKEVFSK